MPSPSDLKYSETHEWFRADGDVVTMGITRFATAELTDVTYVEMKPPGTEIAAGGPVGEVESVKATSDVYSVVGGTIVDVNGDLTQDPSILNRDPYEQGWLVKIQTTDNSPLEKLMDQETYDRKNPVD